MGRREKIWLSGQDVSNHRCEFTSELIEMGLPFSWRLFSLSMDLLWTTIFLQSKSTSWLISLAQVLATSITRRGNFVASIRFLLYCFLEHGVGGGEEWVEGERLGTC
jgi:hypothetical protein